MQRKPSFFQNQHKILLDDLSQRKEEKYQQKKSNHNNIKPQKQRNNKWERKIGRYIQELYEKHGISRSQKTRLVKNSQNFQEFLDTLNIIRNHSNFNKSLHDNFDIEDFIKQKERDFQRSQMLNENQYHKILNLNNINEGKNQLQQEHDIFDEDTINENNKQSFEIFNFDDENKNNITLQEIEIDPSYILNANINDQQKINFINSQVHIDGFNLSEDNLNDIKNQISKAPTSVLTKSQKEDKQFQDKLHIKYKSTSLSKELKPIQVGPLLKSKNIQYFKTEWGYIRQTSNSIQFQGDIQNKKMWQAIIKKEFKNSKYINYSVIIIDPPWDNTNLDLGYDKMKDEAWMQNIDLQNLQKNGFIYIWATNQKIPAAIDYIQRNGYKMCELITWVKINKFYVTKRKIGYYLMHCTEYCICGVKKQNGYKINDIALRCKNANIIFAETRISSQKPDAIYDIAEEQVKQGHFLEIFARKHNQREYWSSVGNESIQFKGKEIEELSDFQGFN